MARIYVIHENDAWVEPLRAALDELGLPFEEWFLSEGRLDFDSIPPEGVFYNRMSASSHTRGHRYAAEYTGCVLAWLEAHGRRVINTCRALQLEISKIAQYAALSVYGTRRRALSPRWGGNTSSWLPGSSTVRSSPSTTAQARDWACACSMARMRSRRTYEATSSKTRSMA